MFLFTSIHTHTSKSANKFACFALKLSKDQTIKGSPSSSIPAVKATLFSEITSTPQTGSPVCANSAFSTPMGNTPTTSSFLATQSSPLISRTMAIVSHLSRYRLPLTSFVSFANGVSNAASADELTKLLDGVLIDCFCFLLMLYDCCFRYTVLLGTRII